jgi:hypothetical protein
MVTIIQQHYKVRKKHSLVLNNVTGHHGHMNQNQKTSKAHQFRTFMRHAWDDQVRANRSLFRVQPYDDYLINQRGRR